MYEFSLTNSVANTALALCKKAGWSKIRRILVKVGSMRKINPELMSFIFTSLVKDTPAEDALLSVMIIPVTLHCYTCGHVSVREDTQFLCPSCESRNVQLLSGLEFNIEVLEVES
ncbi:MAG: hydrogenase maturation nickel metallochaperone HypA [Synergistales bacterium]|nr:hydrogenase maturation nickel metallochaperone HypA [Synergistales bacterium]MDY6401090.1 hydrogenase maturation nickel metallochaperone HypA [Synergistales bacterium]MDY6404683.1 hydrogenase maturation nickel metallochaperone HypA [Synergistales bacterium]MDY6410901.1 hydrogenase maturation nickel metallochaperone HypA [Synergistales bacterium]MDY6415128.1 hydrogenase maturation nickel metallochaperone HypA [Synergistales bacterium]